MKTKKKARQSRAKENRNIQPKNNKPATKCHAPNITKSALSLVSGNSTAIQERQVLAMLRKGKKTTLDFRRAGICHPAARIQSLREQNHRIVTHWTVDYDEAGKPHRVAKYALLTKKRRAA